jgi:phosphoglucosamine mutase
MQHLFGTDGIRARVGQSPLTPQELVAFGAAVGAWMCRTHPSPHILMAHDTRHSAPLVKASLKAGLFQYPVTLFDADVMPTPALFHQVMHGPYDYGIMITASHNPYQDNGIKIITKKEGKLTEAEEQELNALYAHNPYRISYEHLGKEQKAADPLAPYLEALTDYFPQPFLQGITIVLDCANGAYASSAPTFLKELGANIIPLAITPTGKNINDKCGSLYPHYLQEAVIAHQAHAGFAFDGDGDRLSAVTKNGICKDGDELLAFLLNHPTYQHESAVVGTILSNEGLALHLAKQNKVLYRTQVGDKNVVQKMTATGALIGGEPSGHLILRDFTDTADGLFTLLRLAQTAHFMNDWNFTSFKKFPQVTLNVPVTSKKDLNGSPYATIITTHQAELTEGRVIVRYSGTEPLLRIMVETSDEKKAYTVGHQLSEALLEAFKVSSSENEVAAPCRTA